MKKFFNIFVIFISAIFIGISFPLTARAREVSLSFGFSLQTDKGNFDRQLDWWQQEVPTDGWYYITLPAQVKNTRVTVNITGADHITLNGDVINNGDVITAPGETANRIKIGDKSSTLYVLYTSNIPAIYIDTLSGDMSRVYADIQHREPGNITIIDNDSVVYTGKLEYIKGRGNTTFTQPKKPFKLKFTDKVNLFGMGSDRSWLLLADYVDVSLLKSQIAYDFADTVGLEYTPQAKKLDLFIDGKYIGNYTLTEKVEIDNARINIKSLEDLNKKYNPDVDFETLPLGGVRGPGSEEANGSCKYVQLPVDPPTITGGYLLEYETYWRYDEEISGFVTDYGQNIIVKSPEYASQKQVEYISDYYQQFEDAILSNDGYNSYGKHYSYYMDMDSMVKMYLFQEYVKNMDVAVSSFFIYKDMYGKFTAGPAWDFDMALGHLRRIGNIEMSDSNGLYATGKELDNGGYTILSLLACRPEFRQAAAEEWNRNFKPRIEVLLESVDALDNLVKDSAIADKTKWTEGFARPVSDIPIWRGDKVSELKSFLKMRAEFMDEAFSESNMYVAYYGNGVNDAMLDANYYTPDNNTARIKSCRFENGDGEFLGWNTKADGSGESYNPGDKIQLTETLQLYAQWDNYTPREESFFSRIIGFLFG